MFHQRFSEQGQRPPMWDTPAENVVHISHNLPCHRCGHELHTYLPCAETCDCPPCIMPGTI